MATHTTNKESYEKIEKLVMGKMFDLENENEQLKQELTIAKAKLEIYERLANISSAKTQLGFGPPIAREEG